MLMLYTALVFLTSKFAPYHMYRFVSSHLEIHLKKCDLISFDTSSLSSTEQS